MPLGLLCVVTKENVHKGREIFECFRSMGADTYSLLPLIEVPGAVRPEALSNDELFELFTTTFELWMREDNSFSCIEPLDTMVRSLLGERPRLCSFASSCLKRMITVGPDGTVFPCASLSAFPLGNVLQNPLSRILHGRSAQRLRRVRARATAEYCGECRHVALCRGGCREVAYWHSGHYEAGFAYCAARKKTFGYLECRLRELLEKCPSFVLLPGRAA